MSKLNVAYILCPLIDQKSLLGVSEDSESGHVIVTLGKNIVIRYKLLDQKQINSWSSKDKFTSQVIFDKELSQYVSVINQNQLKMWNENQQQLDKVKRVKFEREIHCILSRSDGSSSLVVFQDGTVLSLKTALAKRKAAINYKALPVGPNLAIQDCQLITHCGNKYVAYLTVTSKSTEFHVIPIDQSNASPLRVGLKRNKMTLRGHAVVQDEYVCSLYTLWSDGRLFCMHLLPSLEADSPGTLVQTVSSISCKHTVAMTTLSSGHIAMYGADVSEEGAIILIFNTKYKLIQAKQRSKLFGIAPRLWCIGTNIFVASGNFLSVVPFRLDVARLAALVGSHVDEEDEIQTAVWGGDKASKAAIIHAPKSVQTRMEHLKKLGWSQCAIINDCLPSLLDSKDVSSILWCLENFDDIPEKFLVQILGFCLSEPDSTFSATMDVDGDGTSELSEEKKSFIDVVLNVAFADVSLMPHLRSISLSNTLLLLQHLSEKMDDAKAIEWVCLLLDSHYQEYLLSKDPHVLSVLNKIRSSVNVEVADIQELKSIEPLLSRVSLGKSVVKKSHGAIEDYSIEVVKLY